MIYVHDLSQYALGTKDEEPAADESSGSGAAAGGTAQTVCAALVAHVHRHPVVLMLQDTASGEYRLPGGAVPAGEDEVVVAQEARMSLAQARCCQTMMRSVVCDRISNASQRCDDTHKSPNAHRNAETISVGVSPRRHLQVFHAARLLLHHTHPRCTKALTCKNQHTGQNLP